MKYRSIARDIMEARNGSYAQKPSGFMDETDLLLLSQALAEEQHERERRRRLAKKRRKEVLRARQGGVQK